MNPDPEVELRLECLKLSGGIIDVAADMEKFCLGKRDDKSAVSTDGDQRERAAS